MSDLTPRIDGTGETINDSIQQESVMSYEGEPASNTELAGCLKSLLILVFYGMVLYALYKIVFVL